MQNLKSSNAKRRKLLYYLYHTPIVYFFPKIISRLRLKNILNNSLQEEYIQSRASYYFKKTSNFRVSNKGKKLSELFWNQFFKNKQNSHFIDFYMLLQFFDKKNKVDFIYSTKDYIDSSIAKKHPPYPTFVKSRPVGFNNQNSILLKLNRVKLFHFIKDPKKFENKKNQAVWRGDIRNNPRREYLSLIHI
mgnify:FL=1